jgi:hypothetical protein
VESLLQDGHRVAAGDDHARRKIHRVIQTLGRRNGLALKDDVVAHRFHAKHPNTVLCQNREDSFFETVKVSIHHVERHLHRIEPEPVLRSRAQHLQMNLWTFVAGEADKTDLARFLSFDHSLHPASLSKNAVRVSIPNHFMELE